LEHPPLHPAIDQFAAEVIALPSVRAVYVFGSAADGTALPSSDIDLFVVARGGDGGAARLREIAERIDGPPLDLVIVDEAELLRDGHFRIERASRLVAGDDIRPELPRTTLDAFMRRYGDAPHAYMAIFRPGQPLVAPLDYPDPDGPFYGYDSRTLPPAGEAVHNIKALVALVCWIATLRLARERGLMAASKAESVVWYTAEIHDEWSQLVAEVYRDGHDRWHYRVPEGDADRALLRGLCEQVLAFENDYLMRAAQQSS
jgi:predicted nucleotidyltransferase